MQPARPYCPRSRLAFIAVACALGCKPVQVVHPVVPGQVYPAELFAAPPVASTSGVIVEPFTMDPTAPPPTIVPFDAPGNGGPSQIHIPVANRDWTWEQLVDVFDDYFRIDRERQVQVAGDMIGEGRVDSHPQISPTVLEPHRLDSVGRFNRWESTFQTIRRRASMRVIPDATGYLVDIRVEKDLEDLARPENATAGAASFRNDDSLSSDREEFVSRTRLATNWILLGRDPELERQMLSDIQQRFSVAPVAPAVQ